MTLLLDSHIFLWYKGDELDLLPDGYLEAISDPENEVYVSVASEWELLIKHSIGKLPLASPGSTTLRILREQADFNSLLVDEGSLEHLDGLPLLHRDPFDRILIAQANQHGMKLMTVDQQIKQYPQATVFTP